MKYRKLNLTLSALTITGLVGCASVDENAGIVVKGYTKADGPSNTVALKPVLKPSLSFSSINFGNGPEFLFDDDFATRWSSKGEHVWVVFDYANPIEFNAVRLAFFKGNGRISRFDIEVSNDGRGWTPIIVNGESSGKTDKFERFPFINLKSRYIKFIGYGNTENIWSALTEFQVVNCKVNFCPISDLINQK